MGGNKTIYGRVRRGDRMDECRTCKGTGNVCRKCDGSGKTFKIGWLKLSKPCEQCNGLKIKPPQRKSDKTSDQQSVFLDPNQPLFTCQNCETTQNLAPDRDGNFRRCISCKWRNT